MPEILFFLTGCCVLTKNKYLEETSTVLNKTILDSFDSRKYRHASLILP